LDGSRELIGPGSPLGVPHNNAGVNVLYYDGSVVFVLRPGSNTRLPAGLGYGLNDTNNSLINQNLIGGWPASLYNSQTEGGNVDDFLNFWPYVNVQYDGR